MVRAFVLFKYIIYIPFVFENNPHRFNLYERRILVLYFFKMGKLSEYLCTVSETVCSLVCDLQLFKSSRVENRYFLKLTGVEKSSLFEVEIDYNRKNKKYFLRRPGCHYKCHSRARSMFLLEKKNSCLNHILTVSFLFSSTVFDYYRILSILRGLF